MTVQMSQVTNVEMVPTSLDVFDVVGSEFSMVKAFGDGTCGNSACRDPGCGGSEGPDEPKEEIRDPSRTRRVREGRMFCFCPFDPGKCEDEITKRVDDHDAAVSDLLISTMEYEWFGKTKTNFDKCHRLPSEILQLSSNVAIPDERCCKMGSLQKSCHVEQRKYLQRDLGSPNYARDRRETP